MLTSDKENKERCSFEMHSVQEVATSAARDLDYPNLEARAVEVVEAFMKGHNVFAVLPTGYSAMASLCYRCLPIVFHKLLGRVEKTVPSMLDRNNFQTTIVL